MATNSQQGIATGANPQGAELRRRVAPGDALDSAAIGQKVQEVKEKSKEKVSPICYARTPG